MPKTGAAVLSDYQIFETKEFSAKFKKLEKSSRVFLEHKLPDYVYPRLRQAPYFGPQIKKLSAIHPDTWRYRLGKYRLFYQIDEIEKIVFILTIELRRDAYK